MQTAGPLTYVPVMMFRVSRDAHWKFTPQCEVYPIAKSICMSGYRQDSRANIKPSCDVADTRLGHPPHHGTQRGTAGYPGHRRTPKGQLGHRGTPRDSIRDDSRPRHQTGHRGTPGPDKRARSGTRDLPTTTGEGSSATTHLCHVQQVDWIAMVAKVVTDNVSCYSLENHKRKNE